MNMYEISYYWASSGRNWIKRGKLLWLILPLSFRMRFLFGFFSLFCDTHSLFQSKFKFSSIISHIGLTQWYFFFHFRFFFSDCLISLWISFNTDLMKGTNNNNNNKYIHGFHSAYSKLLLLLLYLFVLLTSTVAWRPLRACRTQYRKLFHAKGSPSKVASLSTLYISINGNNDIIKIKCIFQDIPLNTMWQ